MTGLRDAAYSIKADTYSDAQVQEFVGEIAADKVQMEKLHERKRSLEECLLELQDLALHSGD
jgi:hypothetical protein